MEGLVSTRIAHTVTVVETSLVPQDFLWVCPQAITPLSTCLHDTSQLQRDSGPKSSQRGELRP